MEIFRAPVRHVALPFVLGLALLGPAACGGATKTAAVAPPSTGPASSASPASSAPAPSSASPAEVVSVKVAPGTATGFVEAMQDVSAVSCTPAGAAGWQAAGDVTNSSGKVADYRIYTLFLDTARATRGLLEVDVAGVAPGEKRQWSGTLQVAASGLTCGVRVERTPAG